VAPDIWPRIADPEDRKALIELIFERITVDRHARIMHVELWPPLHWATQHILFPHYGSRSGLLGGPTVPDLEPTPWPTPRLQPVLARLLAV
jgi:hypothetical protein